MIDREMFAGGRRSVPGCTAAMAFAVGCLCTTSLTHSAIAQTVLHPVVRAGGKDVVEEVVVTAEKRASTVQKATLSITALSGAALQQQGITTVAQVAQITPGISLRSSGPGQTELEMRGMSSSGGSSPTVGFYLDETPLTPPAASLNGKVVIDPDLFDLNRVEVLRGPQGTLYGSGSMGGTIRLVSNQPDLTQYHAAIDTTLSGTVGGGVNPTGKIMANIPIVKDMVALRVVGEEKYVDGWIDRIVASPFPVPTGQGGDCGNYTFIGCTRGDVRGAASQQKISDVNWEWQQSARASLLVQPFAGLSFTTSGLFQRITMGGYNEYDLPPGSTVLAHYQPFNLHEPFSDTFKLGSETISYDLGFAQLTSGTSYWARNEQQSQDASEAIYSLLNSFGLPDTGFVPIRFTEQDKSHQFSEEIRLASQGDGRFNWLAGGFYSQLTSTFHDINGSPDLAYLSTGGPEANPDGIVYNANNPYHVRQFAAFGEASYRIIPTVKFTAGLRYFNFNTHVNEIQSGIGTFSGNATPTTAYFKTNSSGVTPKFNVGYEPNSDLTLYATASKGFRPGGVNLPIPTSIGCTLTNEVYKPDTSWNYEGGEKARLFDRTLQVNADFYYIKWTKVQQLINQACGYPLTQNAGDASTYGPEIEITWHVTPELTLAASGAYTHAALTSVNPLVSGSLSKGSAILNIPKYTESTSVTYRRPFNDAYDFMARVSNSYVGPSTDISFSRLHLSPYDIIDLRTGLEGTHWSGHLFVDNLTNKHAEISANTTSFAWVIPSLTRIATNQPLTFGLNVGYKF